MNQGNLDDDGDDRQAEIYPIAFALVEVSPIGSKSQYYVHK